VANDTSLQMTSERQQYHSCISGSESSQGLHVTKSFHLKPFSHQNQRLPAQPSKQFSHDRRLVTERIPNERRVGSGQFIIYTSLARAGINRKIHNVGYRTEQKNPPSTILLIKQTQSRPSITGLECTCSVLLVDVAVSFLLFAVLEQHCGGHD
jgi:hypothetical protein